MKRSFIIGASALLGLAAGFALRAWSPAPDAVDAAASRAAAASAPAAPPKLTRAALSPLAEQTQANLSLSGGVTRWLHWMTAVEKAGPADFPGLARLAKDLPGALNMLAARWIDRDPQGMFDACLQASGPDEDFPMAELAQRLMQEWPKRDPEAVLAVLKAHPDLSNGWQFTALNALFDIRPEQALITMSALGINNYGPNMQGVAAWAAANPRHAAEVALAHPAGYASERVLEAIAKEWAKSDPSGALAFSLRQENAGGREMAGHVLREWMGKDLGAARQWLTAADDSARERLLPAFVEVWGKNDPANALQWCLSSTAGSLRHEVVRSLIKGTAAQDLAAAAGLVAGMEPSPLRSDAASTFADMAREKGWFPSTIMSGPMKSATPEALAWLGQLDAAARRTALSSLTWSWAAGNPRDFAAFLQTEAGRESPAHSWQTVARGLVRENPQEALEWAAKVPEASRAEALSATFHHWTASQPQAALSWLRELPASDPRRVTFYEGALDSLVPLPSFQNTPEISSLEPLREARKKFAQELASDPAAARRTLGGLKLSDAERTRAAALLQLE